jgi:protocatechuate 3,4-dioxygenase beta subunit
MNRRMIISVAAVLCSIALAGCAGTPTSITPVGSTTDQLVPATGNTSTGTIPAAADSSALACEAGSKSATLTPELTEGPFFKANSPERASLLESNTAGMKLVITGYVYTTDCLPVPHALLDFWQANANGVYDNSGYTLRGHQYTDANGRYQLTTIVPGLYTGRTEHIHVKVQAPNGTLITTQLFFPGVPQNDTDGIYNPALLMVIQQGGDGEQGRYNFVVPTQ